MSARFVSVAALEHYRGHLREALREDGVVCLECGRICKTKGVHVLKGHSLSLDDYREKWGYNRQTRFTGADTHEKMRRRPQTVALLGHVRPDALQRAWAARRRLTRRREGRLVISEGKRALYATGWQPRRHRKIDDDAFRALVAEGLTIRQIAARAGLTLGTVYRRLHALGLPVPAPETRKARDEQLLALRREGLRAAAIAARLGMSASRVTARLRQLQQRGAALPPLPPRAVPGRLATDEQLVAFFREGLSAAEIAARVGMTLGSVENRLRKLRQRGILPPLPGQEGKPPRTRVLDKNLLPLAQRGLSAGEMAYRLGMRRHWVLKRLWMLRKRGVAVPRAARGRPGVPRRRLPLEQIVAFTRQGLRPAEIAARLGIAYERIGHALWRLRRKGLLPPARRRHQANRAMAASP